MVITVIKNIGNQNFEVCVCDDQRNEVTDRIGYFETADEAEAFERLLKRMRRD
ncbi:MAG: hypothetical protein IIY21_00210 [Clostridiales bacterium]|nr:hypothetical protein [Clostridiales bacterium]MBQ1570965.1 hypothetical protein [Clostridiales bacterium]